MQLRVRLKSMPATSAPGFVSHANVCCQSASCPNVPACDDHAAVTTTNLDWSAGGSGAGQRRYAASAVRDVGLILFFREIGSRWLRSGVSLQANGNPDGT